VILTSAPSQQNIYDLVHDGVTSSDGGDNTVTAQDLSVSATLALEAVPAKWQTASAVGPADRTNTESHGYPTVPLAAAQGTRPDDDFASSAKDAPYWNARQKAAAIGQERIASLIGTVGNGPTVTDKSGSTVFLVAGNPVGFNDGGIEAGGRSSSVGYAFAPSASSTATITIAGAGNLSRQRPGGGFTIAAANSLQVSPPVDGDAPQSLEMADAAQPTLGYTYAPQGAAQGNATARTNSVAASFSDAITATGLVAQTVDLTTRGNVQTSQLQSGQSGSGKVQTSQLQSVQSGTGKVQTSQLQPVQSGNGKIQTSQLAQPGQSGKVQTSQPQAGQDRVQISDTAVNPRNLLDLTQTLDGPRNPTQVDGTRTLISASVSANPSATAARYMANVVNATRNGTTGQTVEAFQVGPTAGPAKPGTTVADPLHGKIMASAGALNNALALP